MSSKFMAMALLAAIAASPAAQAATSSTFSGPGFFFAYPGEFSLTRNPAGADWRWNQADPGQSLVRIDLPPALEPRTNFDGASFSIGRSADPKARAACLVGDAPAKIRIGDVDFLRFTDSDAGMSHYHDITSYRALHRHACIALEYTINSTSLGVYDPSAGLKAFDPARIRAILNGMVETFRFR
jgi:hypothetical protein